MNEQERIEFGHEIRAMRKGQAITQEELADRAGVGLRTIRNLEAGRVELQPGNLAAVLDALGYRRPPRPWDDEVEGVITMIGYKLAELDTDARAYMVGRLTLIVLGRSSDNERAE